MNHDAKTGALGCLDIGFKWFLSPFTDLGAIPSLTIHPHLLTETTLLKPTKLPQTTERKSDNTLDTRSKHQGHLATTGTHRVDVSRPPPPLPRDLFPRHNCLVHEFIQVEPERVVGEVDFIRSWLKLCGFTSIKAVRMASRNRPFSGLFSSMGVINHF